MRGLVLRRPGGRERYKYVHILAGDRRAAAPVLRLNHNRGDGAEAPQLPSQIQQPTHSTRGVGGGKVKGLEADSAALSAVD